MGHWKGWLGGLEIWPKAVNFLDVDVYQMSSEEEEPVSDLENLSARLGLPVWWGECEAIVCASVQRESLESIWKVDIQVNTGTFSTFWYFLLL